MKSQAVYAIGFIAILSVIIISGCVNYEIPNNLSDEEKITCDTLCLNNGYSGAISESCISIFDCNEPNMVLPINDEYNIRNSNGDECDTLHVCCCSVE